MESVRLHRTLVGAALALAVGSTPFVAACSHGNRTGLNQPQINTIAPTEGSTAGGTAVTIQGVGFDTSINVGGGGFVPDPTLRVLLGGAPLLNVVVVDNNTITGVTPPGTAGPADLFISHAGGAFQAQGIFLYIGPPALQAINPAEGPDVGGTAVTITGADFVGAAVTVTIGGVPLVNLVVVDSQTITGTTPAGVPSAGGSDVVVTNANGAATLVGGFDYVPIPTLTAINPIEGSTAGGTAVTVDGTGFFGTNTVTIGGAALTNQVIVSDTQITGLTPAGVAGQQDVVVTNVAGSDTLVGAFTFVPGPVITSIAPNEGPENTAIDFAIVGTGFFGANITVTIGGIAVSNLVIVDDQNITGTTAATIAAAAVDVVVNTTGGSDTLVGGFTFCPIPTVTAIDPTNGVAAGNTPVTITGTGFDSGSSFVTVTIGGVALVGTVVVNDTTITGTTPVLGVGQHDVDVATAGGTGSLVNGFTAFDSPLLLSDAVGAFGSAVAVGDTDGVGGADALLVGAPGANANDGQVVLFRAFDPTTGTFTNVVTINAPVATAAGRFGASVAFVDSDLDGSVDLVVIGEPNVTVNDTALNPQANAGLAHIFNFAGVQQGQPLGALPQIDPLAGDLLGSAVTSGATDTDLDGVVDATVIIVGASGFNDGNAGSGAFFVYDIAGNDLGFLTNPVSEANAAFGAALAMGDTNLDAIDDIVVGAPGATAGALAGAGSVGVFDGLTGGLTLITDPNAEVNGAFGTSVAMGDVDGDADLDIVVGAPGAGAGAGSATVLVSNGLAFAAQVFAPVGLVDPAADANGAFGTSVAMGDLNGDGFADVAVGSPAGDGAGIDDGEAFVFTSDGAVAGFAVVATVATSTGSGTGFGTTIAMGAFNVDAFGDLVVGDPGASANNGTTAVHFGPNP